MNVGVHAEGVELEMKNVQVLETTAYQAQDKIELDPTDVNRSGHGLFVRNAARVNLDEVSLNDNEGSGMRIHGVSLSDDDESPYEVVITNSEMSRNQRGGLWSQMPHNLPLLDLRPDFKISQSVFRENSPFGMYVTMANLDFTDLTVQGVTESDLTLSCPNPEDPISGTFGCFAEIPRNQYNPDNLTKSYFEGIHLCDIDSVSFAGNSVIDIDAPIGEDTKGKDLFFYNVRLIEVTGEVLTETVTYNNSGDNATYNPFRGTAINALETNDFPLPQQLFWGRPRY
jgi:hypothetical protein